MNRPIRETALGAWISKNAPQALDVVGDVLPERGALGILKRIVDKSSEISDLKKREFQSLLDRELELAEQVTRRWEADASSDAPLARIIRPVALIVTLVLFFAILLLDSFEGIAFQVPEAFVSLLETLTLTISGAYFAGRTLEKTFRR